MKKTIAKQLSKFELIDLINACDLMLSYIDTDYVYRAANDAYVKYFQLPLDQIINHPVRSVIGDELFETKSKPNLDRAFNGEELRYESWYPLPNNEKIYLHVHYLPSIDENGKIIGAIVSATDLTERKNLENQSKFYEQMLVESSHKAQLGEMIAFIAHQWRGPLNQLNTYLLQMRTNKNKIAEENFTVLEMILVNLSENIENLYQLYHQPIKDSFDINELLKHAKSLLEYRLFSKNITLRLKGDKHCIMRSYSSYILQVLVVFIENSIDSLNKTKQTFKEITVEGSCNKKLIIFDIYDNGAGIDYSNPYTIFNPGVSSKSTNGHGFGLYFAHKIITEYLQGNIEILQHSPGTWFRITIPA